jgi:LysM repeat protein
VANHTITEKQVLDIQKMLQAGKTLSVIAKKYGVSDMQIHRIKTGENWGSITGIKYKKPAPKKTITKKVDSKKSKGKKSRLN